MLEGDNEVWADFRRNPADGRIFPIALSLVAKILQYLPLLLLALG